MTDRTPGNVASNTNYLANKTDSWSDAFEELVTKGTRNALDLPSFYNFSEERYRFIENGTRIENPDSESTKFTDTGDQFLLEPNAGDTLQLKTAEKPRYVVGNDADVSWAFRFETPLQDETDKLKLFVEDSFEIEYNGAEEIIFRTLLDGTEEVSKTVSPPNELSDPSRPELEFNWYGVGRAKLEIDWTGDNEQQKTDPEILTVDDDWLSDDPTGRVGFELDVTNSGIQLEAGSIAYVVKSDTPPTGRPKPHVFSSDELNQIAATGYTVVGALRIDPDRTNVFTTITAVEVNAETAVDVELFLKAVGEGQTDADFLDVDDDGTEEGPIYPRSTSPQSSVLQWTPNVSTFPTRTYALTGAEIPDGRAAGASTEGSTGAGAGVSKQGRAFARARPIYEDDVILMIGHTPDEQTSTEVDVFVETEQDW